jgi:ABC-type uncharacterized transport system ATPase subunit
MPLSLSLLPSPSLFQGLIFLAVFSLQGAFRFLWHACYRQGYNGLTIVLVTHEPDIAQFAKRVLVFRDGTIRKDDPVLNRPKAAEVLKTLPTLED